MTLVRSRSIIALITLLCLTANAQVFRESPVPTFPYSTSLEFTADRYGPYVTGVTGHSTSNPFFDTWSSYYQQFVILSPGLPSQKRVLFPQFVSGWFHAFGGTENQIHTSLTRTSGDSLFLVWSNMDKQYTDMGPFLYQKDPVTRLSVQQGDSFRTLIAIPNGLQPNVDAGLNGALHMVWGHVTPNPSNWIDWFHSYKSSIVYRERDPSGAWSDSSVIGKGRLAQIRSVKGTEHVLYIAVDSNLQKTGAVAYVKGSNGTFSAPQALYPLNEEMMLSIFGFSDRFEPMPLQWHVDSAGGVHTVQHITRISQSRLYRSYRSPEGAVWVDSLSAASPLFRFQEHGTVSIYRVNPAAANEIERFESVPNVPVKKTGSFAVPANTALKVIIVDAKGKEHMLLQGAGTDQAVFLVRNADGDSAVTTLIAKGFVIGTTSYTDKDNGVKLTGSKAGQPLVLTFSLDSMAVFEDFRFPLSIGNEWHYKVTEFSDPGSPPPPTFEIARADSHLTMKNGKQYLRITSKRWMPSYYRMEGLRVYQYSPKDSTEYLRMDFTKRQGDTVAVYGPAAYQKGIIELRMQHQLFGVNGWSFAFKGAVPKLDSVSSIIVMDSLGIIGRSIPVGPTWELIGAKINGKSFGTLLSVTPEPAMMPADLRVEQNYPNPFNPTTTIRYHLPADGLTTLHVFDMLGRKVAALVDGQRSAGLHSVVWDASQYASGVYVAVVTSNGKQQFRRMLLLK